MRSINTLIWLGPDRGHAKAALELVADIWLHINEERQNRANGDALARRSSANWTEYTRIDSVQPMDKRSGALATLLQSPWFERCWVSIECNRLVCNTSNVYILDPPRGLCI